MTWSDIDAVVIGKAPDMFEGVMMPELYLADALGAVGKPMIRVHTAGSVGGSTAMVATHSSRPACTSACSPSRSRSSRSPTPCGRCRADAVPAAAVAGAGGYFAPLIRGYMRRSKAPEDIGIKVAFKDRLNALKNPYAHLHEPDITYESVKESPMLWDPIRYPETCPSSDGACAMVLGREKVGDEAAAQGRSPAWIHGTAVRSEPTMSAGRDTGEPAGRRAAAPRPCTRGRHHRPPRADRLRRDLRAVQVVRADVAGEPRLRRPGEGWKMVEDGATEIDGDLPVNMSRRRALAPTRSAPPGMIRFAEAAMQVRGPAGEHQVDGARLAVGHAYGGGSQFFAMWVVGAEKP